MNWAALLTLAIMALCMAPGVLLMRGVAPGPGQLAAAATASVAVVLLAAALVGQIMAWVGLGPLPAWIVAPVALAACAPAAWLTHGHAFTPVRPEWHGLAFTALMVGFSFLSLALGMERTSDGGLLAHSWYNADWFKHMGHVHGLADYGLPARDIFGGGAPLHYYWLSYIPTGAAAALADDGWAALATFNAIITALFAMTFYGVIRWVAQSAMALAGCIAGVLVTAPIAFFLKLVSGPGWAELVNTAPNGPALLNVAQIIPQHTLATTLLLSAVLLHRPGVAMPRAIRWLVLISLATTMTISILLGALLLGAYGLLQLWQRRWAALPELAVLGMAAGALVLVLGVLQLGNAGSPLESPLFSNTTALPWPRRIIEGWSILFFSAGLALPAALLALRYWKPRGPDGRHAREFAVFLLIATLLFVAATQALAPPRVAIEVLIRAGITISIAVAVIGTGLLQMALLAGGAARLRAGVGAVTVIVVALPTAVAGTAWIANFGDAETTLIPGDDMRAMADLRARSDARAVVWQYPENPFLAYPSGRDAWAVIVAGRTVINSQRATDYAAAEPMIALSKRFFAGDDVAVPAQADWVYLSRALHPASYYALVVRMRADPAFAQSSCYADACLFSRVRKARP